MRLARMLQAVDVHAAGEPGRVVVGGHFAGGVSPLRPRLTPTPAASAAPATIADPATRLTAARRFNPPMTAALLP